MFDVIFLFIYSSIGFSLVLIFGYIQTNISNELLKEAKKNLAQRDRYIKMFDALQEGIIVVQGANLIFLNDICNKMLSYITTTTNFMLQKDQQVNPIDQKIFFLYDNKNDAKKVKTKEKNTSENVSEEYNNQKEFCIREIAAMTVKELNSMIFTFDKRLMGHDITKI